MAQVTTTYKAELAEHIGVSSEEYDAQNIKGLLKEIKARHGKDVYKKAKTMLITINQLSIQNEHHYAARLADGDIVGFFPLAAGG